MDKTTALAYLLVLGIVISGGVFYQTEILGHEVSKLYDPVNETSYVFLDENLIFSLEQIDEHSDLTYRTERFNLTSYVSYNIPATGGDWTQRIEKHKGKFNIISEGWTIQQDEVYYVTIPDYGDVVISQTIEYESITDITSTWVEADGVDYGVIDSLKKYQIPSANGTAIIGADSYKKLVFKWTEYQQTGTHQEERIRKVMTPFSGGFTIEAGKSYIVELTLTKPAEVGETSYFIVPKLYGLEFPEFSWWNTSYLGRIPITISTNGTSTPAWYQKNENITSIPDGMNTSCLGIALTNLTGGTQLPYWIESRDNSSYCNLWINLSDAITDPGSDIVWMYFGNDGVSDGGVGADVFQSFFDGSSTGWTEVDGTNRFAFVNDRIEFTTLSRNDQVYVYKDLGAGNIPSAMKLNFEGAVTASGGTYNALYDMAAIANEIGVDSAGYAVAKTVNTIAVQYHYGSGGVYIHNEIADTDTSSAVIAISIGTTYYYTLQTTGTTTTLYVYSDEARTTQVAGSPKTLANAGTTYRYLYLIQAQYDNDASWGSGWQDNQYLRKYIANETTSSVGTAQYYIDSLLNSSYNNSIVGADITVNASVVEGADTNWTANSTGTTYWTFTTVVNATGYTNFTLEGDDLDNFTTSGLTGSTLYNLSNSSGVVEAQTTNGDGIATFDVDLIAGTYWISTTGGEGGAPDTLFEYYNGSAWVEGAALDYIYLDCWWWNQECDNAEQTAGQPSLRITNNGTAAGTPNMWLNTTCANTRLFARNSSDWINGTELSTSSQAISSELAVDANVTLWAGGNLSGASDCDFKVYAAVNAS